MKSNVAFFLSFLWVIMLTQCNPSKEEIGIYRKNRSVTYEIYHPAWKDTFYFGTKDYDTGFPLIHDSRRNILFLFDNYVDIYKINGLDGSLIDKVNIVGKYGKYSPYEKNKLIYAYPALFYYYDELIVHYDISGAFIEKAYYFDSLSNEIDKRYPEGGYTASFYIDSVRLVPPDKIWVRMSNAIDLTEDMIFKVNAEMSDTVIYSTYIVR